MTAQRRLGWAFLCALGVAWGCSGDDDGGLGPEPAAFRFEPPTGSLTVTVFTPVEFRVTHASGRAVTASFQVNGTYAKTASSFVWWGSRLGLVEITATVEDGAEKATAQWAVQVSDEGAKATPPVIVIDGQEGGAPASVDVTWEAPPPSLYTIPIRSYDLGYALHEISEENFESIDRVVVAHDSLQIVQRHRLDGLVERGQYQIRIRVRDVLDRESELSPSLAVESTGHFDLSGRVSVLEKLLPLRPLANVLVEQNGYKDFTSGDGFYDLRNLPDVVRAPLRVRDDSDTYYTVETDSLPPVDQEMDFVLFPRRFITFPGSEGDITWSMVEFLRRMTKNFNTEDARLYGWDQYPVLIHAHEFTNIHGVDYKQALINAAQAWNDMAGDELLRVVDREVSDPVDALVGIYYATDLPPESVLHGETKVVEPEDGRLYQSIPVRVRIRFQNKYTSQEFVDRLSAHELGHALFLDHSDGLDHIMHLSIPSVTRGKPDEEEAYAARLVAHLPQAFDLDWLSEPDPVR